MKWLLRRFYAIRGFLYVSMRFYTLGIFTRDFEHGSYTRFLNTNRTNDTNFLFHTDLTDHTDLTLEFFEHE